MIKNFVNSLKNLLGYSRSETIGFLVLSVILIIVFVLPFLFGLFIKENSAVSAKDSLILDSLVSILEREKVPVYFIFNPNKLSEDSMYLLGLRPSVVETWQNYRRKGGVFSFKEDFRKVYGLTREDYNALSSYIALPERDERPQKMKNEGDFKVAKIAKVDFEPVDINKAKPEDLLFIKGIGEKLSERIIKFRDLLGGYISKSQFDEVYYLEGEALENLKENVFISDDFMPDKINLNETSYKGIIKHPYIDKEMTDRIFKIRHSADSIVTLKKLEDLMSGKDSLLLGLLPYIDF